MKNKKIVTTGGTGYIGSQMAAELITSDYEVILVDNLFNPSLLAIDYKNRFGMECSFYDVKLGDDTHLVNL